MNTKQWLIFINNLIEETGYSTNNKMVLHWSTKSTKLLIWLPSELMAKDKYQWNHSLLSFPKLISWESMFLFVMTVNNSKKSAETKESDILKFIFHFSKTEKPIFMQQDMTEWKIINLCSFSQKPSMKMLFTKKSTLFMYHLKTNTSDLNISFLLLNTYLQVLKKPKLDSLLK